MIIEDNQLTLLIPRRTSRRVDRGTADTAAGPNLQRDGVELQIGTRTFDRRLSEALLNINNASTLLGKKILE